MCGIYCSVRASGSYAVSNASVDADALQVLSERLKSANTARGPDAKRSHTFYLDASSRSQGSTASEEEGVRLEIEFFASELWLRGHTLVVQPHHREGDVLCWNGEVFEGLKVSAEENDGAKLFERLRSVREPDQIASLLGGIEGPYACVFYHSSSDKVYFARDPLGRRSLLLHKPTPPNQYLILASVSVGSHPAYEFEELSTEVIFCLDMSRLRRSNNLVKEFEDSLSMIPRRVSLQKFTDIPKVNTTLPPEDWPCLAILDHGGAIPDTWLDAVDQLISHLDQSVMLRVRDVPLPPDKRGKARIAVLFSGGIDSAMLAFLADRYAPIDEPIDLLNVAFENPRKMEHNPTIVSDKETRGRSATGFNGAIKAQTAYAVPDRVVGLEELDELRRLCPWRVWNFVEVDVSYEESQEARPIIEATMWPSRTVMDLSLAMALYFASRGAGHIRISSKPLEYKPYTSHARVLLNGVGSDELLGGYGRHRSAFKVKGWQGAIDELQLDLSRIPTRNLGRDDRIISSHGKEARHPFLSLTVVSFIAGLPVHLKLDPRLDPGRGDKTLLRLAASKLGLVEASTRKKRAMQFGTHSARMEIEGGERRKPNGQDYI